MTTLFTTFRQDSEDPSNWLARCEGFRVEVEGRQVGVVQELRFGARVDYPDALVVRGGFLGRRQLMIPSSEVEGVVPREKRVLLRRSSPLA
jgi:hypothetical protein